MKAILRIRVVLFTFVLCLSYFNGTAQNDSISASFNTFPIAGNNYIWFNTYIKINPVAAGTTVYFNDSHIKFTANSVNYNLAVPKSQVTIVADNTLPGNQPAYNFISGSNMWVIRVPVSAANNIFVSGLAFKVPASGFPSNIGPVTWDGQFKSNVDGLDIKWRWSAANYSSFSTDYEALNVTIAGGDAQIATPQNYYTYAVPGAKGQGTGGNLYTGQPTPFKQLYTAVSLKSAAKYVFVALNGTYMDLSNTTLTGDVAVLNGGSLRLSSPTTVNGNVYMNTGTTYQINGILNGTLYTNQNLSQVQTDALNAYNLYKNMVAQSVYTSWNNDITITGTNGLNVIETGSVNLSGSQTVTLNGGPNASFVINVTGGFTMGGSAKILGGGNVDGSKIIINLLGTGSTASSQINNFISGTILAPYRSASLHNVTGQVIVGGNSMTAMSGGVNSYNGYNPPKGNFAAVGQFMFKDRNLNGRKDAGDTVVPNATVILYDSLNNVLQTRTTDYRGFYFIDSIPMPETGAVNFRIKFINPEATYNFINAFAPGSDSTNQSVVNPITGISPTFSLRAGQIKLTINSGIKTEGTLPVKLIAFNGMNAGNENQLYWSTAEEKDNEKVELEYSADNSQFIPIAVFLSTGNSNKVINYSFTHHQISTVNYYRLKITGIDGKFTYSKTIMIKRSGNTISEISVSAYPNPVKERLSIDIISQNGGNTFINLYSSLGNRVKSTIINANKGINHISLENLNQLSPGIYILEVRIGNDVYRQKLLK